MTYNHAFTLAFEVPGCDSPTGENIPREQYMAALKKRIQELYDNDEFEEACGTPFDTYEEPTP